MQASGTVPNWKQIRELKPKEVADFGLQAVKPDLLREIADRA